MPSSDTSVVAVVRQRVHAALGGRLRHGDRPIVVAVSGGADSTCLLDAVISAVDDAPGGVIVGHVDHQMRPESPEDADQVRRLAESMGVPCEVTTVDVPAFARAERIGLEEAARTLRYRALSTMVLRVNALAMLTGHTRSDNVETLLMHILRGSGQRGLASIQPSDQLDARLMAEHDSASGSGLGCSSAQIVRPLLAVDRAETVAYCQARGLTWRDDSSNTDVRFTRNRIRQHLLPVLRTYNPNIDEALMRLAQTARDEERWLDDIVEERVRALGSEIAGGVAFGLDTWNEMPVALRRRVARRIVIELDLRDVGFDAIERVLSVSHAAGPSRVQLPGGVSVSRDGGRLIFHTTAAVTSSCVSTSGGGG